MKNRKYVNGDVEPKNKDYHLGNGYISNGNTIKNKISNGHHVSIDDSM